LKKLGFGFMRLPYAGDKVDTELVKKMVDAFMENGFSYFDTAYKYSKGNIEDLIRIPS
jgi:predicted aldo/keto reductase-like oxidoreductase